MKCIRLKKIEAGVFSLLLLITFFMVTASAQTDSLAVWENIPEGVHTSEWTEYYFNESNFYATPAPEGYFSTDDNEYIFNTSFYELLSHNDSIPGSRWYQTFMVDFNLTGASLEEYEFANFAPMIYIPDVNSYYNGDGHEWINDSGGWYFLRYSFNDIEGSPYFYVSLVFVDVRSSWIYWNGTDWDMVETKLVTEDGEGDNINRCIHGDIRVKTLWNWENDTPNIRSKMWCPDEEEEPIDWLIDMDFDLVDWHYSAEGDNVSIIDNTSIYDRYPGIAGYGAEINYDAKPISFSRIMFWNLSWDTYEETDLPYIACPTFGYDSFMELYEEFIDLDDVWNATQLFKDFINTFDMISYYEDRLYDPLLENQNDTIYVLSQMFTDVRDLWEEEEYEDPEEYDGEFPDNILWLDFFVTPETEEDVTDLLMIRIDTDNNGVYDDYDYTIILWLNDTTFYNGSTEINDTVNWWGAHEKTIGSSPIKEVFRDYNYTRYWLILNWDMFYNGSSGERIGSDLCRMSFMTVDGDTFTTSILQDWNITDDTTPKDPSDDYDIWTNADPTLWLYFEVDESISGESMADPEDPVEEEEYTPARIDTDSIIITLNAFLSVILAIFFIGVVFKLFGKIRM